MVTLARLVQIAGSSIACYTEPTGRDVELCQLIFLPAGGFFDNLSIPTQGPFAYNVTI